jgi:DNA-binding MarR family transcriptional regulator
MNTDPASHGPAEHGTSTFESAIPASVRLWQAVAAAHAALAHELEVEADGGACPVLAADSFAVLLSLADEPAHQLRMHGLAERTHLTPSGLTRRVDKLESEGLLARVGCPGDRRGAFAQLTPRGLDELRRALPHHAAILVRYFVRRIDDAGIDHLTSVLGDLARRLTAAPAPAIARPATAAESRPGTATMIAGPAPADAGPAPAIAQPLPDLLAPATTIRGR